jgi:hypothetical protein
MISHPNSIKQNQSLYMCVQEVQITHVAIHHDKQIQYLTKTRHYSLQNDHWIQKKITKKCIILSVSAAFTGIDRGIGLPSLQLMVPAVAPTLAPNLLIPSK